MTIIADALRADRNDLIWAAKRVAYVAFRTTTGFLLRHSLLFAVLAAAVVMRLLMLRAYPYAFFFSDSRPYVAGAFDNVPYDIRPFGYSVLLKPFVPGPLQHVAVAQHVLGLCLILAGYTFLVHRGVRPWLAAPAMLPIALDARQLTLEHYVLAETTYVALTLLALIVLAWRERIGVVAAAVAGLLLGFAAITRTVGLPVIGLVVLYLLVRRIGWARLVVFLLPVALILGGYLVWYHMTYRVYAFGEFQGRFLYGRVMPIADCDRLKLTPLQRTLCMPIAPQPWKQRPDQYIWNPDSPVNRLYPSTINDAFIGEFAKEVIKQQPGDYFRMVLTETGWHLMPQAPLWATTRCPQEKWLPPAMPGESCNAAYYLDTPSPVSASEATIKVPNPRGEQLRKYGLKVTTPGPVYAAGILLALLAAVFRPRRVSWRGAADSLLFVGTGLGLIVVSVATSMFDYRYSNPAVLLIPMGIALAVNRIVAAARLRRERPPHTEDAAPAPALTASIPIQKTKAAAEHVK
ncbi:hypothetical protein [Actinoplanes sp. NPDC049118]|uniref:hypothetical protein n=1 Tax=Actinoplanes sp. NPDC049118 TaxID=3155769 RepID=UPI0033F1E5C0